MMGGRLDTLIPSLMLAGQARGDPSWELGRHLVPQRGFNPPFFSNLGCLSLVGCVHVGTVLFWEIWAGLPGGSGVREGPSHHGLPLCGHICTYM